MIAVYFILCIILCVAECLEVIPSKSEIVYQNPKFVKNVVANVKREGRRSPYYINVYLELIYEAGDNVTVSFDTNEYVQGHYIPLLFKMEYQLCKFYNEPVIGKMIVQQLPQNLSTCPIPPGFYAFSKILIHMENLPVRMPFTYEAMDVRGRVNIRAFMTKTKEPILDLAFDGRGIQRPINRKL